MSLPGPRACCRRRWLQASGTPTLASRRPPSPLTMYRQLHLGPCGACFVGGLAGEEARVARLHVVDVQCGPLGGHLHPQQLLGWAAILQPPKMGGRGRGNLRPGGQGQRTRQEGGQHLRLLPRLWLGGLLHRPGKRGCLLPPPIPKACALCPQPPAPSRAPPPLTHWTVGTGEPEAWQGSSRGCPTRVVTWPKPSATRSCGGTADRVPHQVFRAEHSWPKAPPPPSPQGPQSKVQATVHHSNPP